MILMYFKLLFNSVLNNSCLYHYKKETMVQKLAQGDVLEFFMLNPKM